MLNKAQIRFALDVMGEMYPEAETELVHNNPFELLIAVVLSAQARDVQVNKVTKELFQKYQKPEDYVKVPLEELQNDLRSINLNRNKAKNIQKLSQKLLEDYDGEVPADKKELEKLAGVGRKTANVVAYSAFGIPAIAIDTHVERVAKRLAICRWDDSVLQVEKTLMKKVPEEEWGKTHHRMLLFGRYFCTAKNPRCPECRLLEICREGQKRMKAGQNNLDV